MYSTHLFSISCSKSSFPVLSPMQPLLLLILFLLYTRSFTFLCRSLLLCLLSKSSISLHRFPYHSSLRFLHLILMSRSNLLYSFGSWIFTLRRSSIKSTLYSTVKCTSATSYRYDATITLFLTAQQWTTNDLTTINISFSAINFCA